jgi:hypothetical protein
MGVKDSHFGQLRLFRILVSTQFPQRFGYHAKKPDGFFAHDKKMMRMQG